MRVDCWVDQWDGALAVHSVGRLVGPKAAARVRPTVARSAGRKAVPMVEMLENAMERSSAAMLVQG